MGNLLKEVKIVAKKNPAKNSSNLNGPGNADFLITSEQLQTCATIMQCLEGRVVGLTFANGIPSLMRNGSRPMKIILDYFTVSPDALMQITPAEIQTIEVLKEIGKTAIYGQGASLSGVLIITTKRADDDNFVARNSGIRTISPKGYHISKEFYSPNYKLMENNKLTDQQFIGIPILLLQRAGNQRLAILTGTIRVFIG